MIRMRFFTTALLIFASAQTVRGQIESEPLKITNTELSKEYRGGACNFDEFTKAVLEVQKRRKERLVTAEEFAKLAATPGTIVLDARSELSFELLRVRGSINLPYTNFGIKTLEELIPNESTKILIYCRNNIVNETFTRVESTVLSNRIVPKERAVGLNIPVAVSLFIYGYKNVWELDEIVDPDNCPIMFDWTPKFRKGAESIGVKIK